MMTAPKSLFWASIFIVLYVNSVAQSQVIDFARDIQPILNAKCVECHGGVKSAAGFSFVYEDRVINFEAESGYVVVKPGDLDESEMVARITSNDDSDRMPPAEAHAPLTKKEIDLVKQWINEGAKWNGHWAFVPPVSPKVPTSAFDELATGEIDHFLFARLEKAGLKPSPLEAPGRLLRRLSLGLTGLPPTLDELDQFESAFAKNPRTAIEETVDDLMARDAFGERWATMWLDLVRYADSGGLGADQRRTIWPYRDWVVNAFNDDIPFDEFTIQQLAGDLIPNPSTAELIATACQRNTQTNNEGGTDDEEFRMEAVIDRVNTTWQTWGSVTFGCLQCHDHPYDPFRNEEYYRFMGFFNNSADSDLENDAPLLSVPNDRKAIDTAAKLRKRSLGLKQKIWDAGSELRDKTDWVGVKALAVVSQNGTKYSVEQKPSFAEFYTVGTVATKTQTHLRLAGENFSEKPITALRLTVLPSNPEKSQRDPEWGFVITKLEAWAVGKDGAKTPVNFRWSVPDVAWLPTDPFREINADGTNWGANSRIHYARELVWVPEVPLEIDNESRLDIHIHCDKTGHGSHPMVIQRGHMASTSDPRWSKFAKPNSRVDKWKRDLVACEEELKKIPGTSLPIMQPRPKKFERPTHVFARGNAMDKQAQVTAGLPASLTKYAPVPANPDSQDPDSLNRLDMARWWVSDNNPLTARVFVNRVWAQLFGIGIVPTLEDFGSSGDKPTHPELLDYLAVRFQKDHQWGIKAIIREMVLSHAFQQSARLTPEVLEIDPANRLLAHGPRLRLSAEFVRDQSLAYGGLLSSQVGGPPVHPPLPDGVWQPFDARDKWDTSKPGEADRYRRSIYTYMKRSIPFPTFATFDAPSREFCTPRRLISNTPLQALVTLNDSAFVECAEALGHRMATEFTGTTDERLARAHRLVTGRIANSERQQQLNQLYENVLSQYSKSNQVQEDQGKSEDQGLEATWTVVAQVLLNLDEALTY